MGQYEQHVFVCTFGKTCAADGSVDVFKALKEGTKAAGLRGRVRINQSGCLNQCGHGPMVVVYPQDIWYCGVGVKGAKRILMEHLVGGEPVEDLRYIAPSGDNKIKTD